MDGPDAPAGRRETRTAPEDIPGPLARAAQAYRMRWKRRRLLTRAWRKRGELTPVTPWRPVPKGAVLCLATVRNEAVRLPFWLAHHRRLGVDHFLIVDNGSDDGTREMLAAEPDVALWETRASYRAARFGVDWLGWLARRHAAGHWALTLDADELLIYPYWEERPITALTAELDRRRQPALGALMVELYSRGRLSEQPYRPGDDPVQALPFFDAGPYRARRQRPARNLWVQGGPRERVFFGNDPRRAPTLNKLPLVKWRGTHAYLNSCHSLLPPRLNLAWEGPGDPRLSGALLHTKFLNTIVERSTDPDHRAEHFGDPARFGAYHDALAADPVLWHEGAMRYEGWRQLERLGLMSSGGWT
jgi:hypothetical protein